MIGEILKYFKPQTGIIPLKDIVTRRIDDVNTNQSTKKQINEYLKIGGKKEVKYWFNEIDEIEKKIK